MWGLAKCKCTKHFLMGINISEIEILKQRATEQIQIKIRNDEMTSHIISIVSSNFNLPVKGGSFLRKCVKRLFKNDDTNACICCINRAFNEKFDFLKLFFKWSC